MYMWLISKVLFIHVRGVEARSLLIFWLLLTAENRCSPVASRFYVHNFPCCRHAEWRWVYYISWQAEATCDGAAAGCGGHERHMRTCIVLHPKVVEWNAHIECASFTCAHVICTHEPTANHFPFSRQVTKVSNKTRDKHMNANLVLRTYM